jgi:hypothetical protein
MTLKRIIVGAALFAGLLVAGLVVVGMLLARPPAPGPAVLCDSYESWKASAPGIEQDGGTVTDLPPGQREDFQDQYNAFHHPRRIFSHVYVVTADMNGMLFMAFYPVVEEDCLVGPYVIPYPRELLPPDERD